METLQPTTVVDPELATLAAIERRVLWLAARIVDYANRERPKTDQLKVGGHQASSASLVTLMTALYFVELDSRDRVSVKPHASPVLHAIEYLLGRLDRSYLTRLRDFGGLQAYPSRTKDPFPVDYSTGSVGLGSVAPLFGALADRYVGTHGGRRTAGRFVSLLGDAELDEGSIWEALAEPLTRELGNVLWIVDLNRQSLDRVVPGIKAVELERHFAAAGWQVLELKYGRRLGAAFELAGGDILRARIDAMPNEQYQGLFGAGEETIRETLLDGLGEERRRALDELLGRYRGELRRLVTDLGGHDLPGILQAFAEARAEPDRPTVLFAYTIKGYGLETAGRPLNHSVLLNAEQVDRLRSESGLTPENEWNTFAPSTAEGQACAAAAARLDRGDSPSAGRIAVPATLSTTDGQPISTQAAFGRILLDLTRDEGLGASLVTVSPDVSVSTNLGGFINKVGVWGPVTPPLYDLMEDTPLRWRVGPAGQHIEMGIAEMNLVLLLGQLGLTWGVQGERLLPVGTLYDPFVMRALEGIVYSVYSGSRFVLAGTPSGISLSREGGAHQSLNTPGIGMETPGLAYAEPCYRRELEWLLLDALAGIQDDVLGEAVYLRLSTSLVDQAPFARFVERVGEERARADVLRGAFRLREPGPGADRVIVAACGAIVPEALAAAERLEDEEGVDALVLCLSSPDRIYRDWTASRRRPLDQGGTPVPSALDSLVGPELAGVPVVTVIDGASHALAWLGSALGTRCVPLGVDRFGQTGSQQELYAEYGISSDAIVTAALVALEP